MHAHHRELFGRQRIDLAVDDSPGEGHIVRIRRLALGVCSDKDQSIQQDVRDVVDHCLFLGWRRGRLVRRSRLVVPLIGRLQFAEFG